MPSARMNAFLLALMLLFGVAAILLPLEVLGVLGAPLVVAGAYIGGRRGGVLIALWAMLVLMIASLVMRQADVDNYVIAVVGYLAIGILVGAEVDRFAAERDQLRKAVEASVLARRQLSASEARYRLLFEQGHDAVYVHGLDAAGEPTRFVSVNDATCALLGYTREELLGLTPRAIDAAPAPGQLRRMMAQLLKEGSVMYESVRRTQDGRLIPVEVGSSLTEVDGELTVLSISRDVSERKLAEGRLESLSLRDELTGLLNRRGFSVMLPEQLKRARRTGHPVVVLYGDLDEFKEFNDAFGHARGDEVLKAVAGALSRTFRETDLVARMGGDEFCVIAEADPGTDPSLFGKRVEEAVRDAGRELGLDVVLSHGELVTDWLGLEDAAAVLARADALMYAEKRARSA